MTKSGKHCGKRRNYSFCAISSFVTMFSKSHLLQRRQKASIWGIGISWSIIDTYDTIRKPSNYIYISMRIFTSLVSRGSFSDENGLPLLYDLYVPNYPSWVYIYYWLTLSHTQHICSRCLWFSKNIETP